SSSGKKEFEEITYIQNRDDLDTHYDIAFITNPTFKHLETLNVIVEKVDYIFLEKPAFSESIDLTQYNYDYKNIYVAAPLRYKNIMEVVRNSIQSKKVYSVRAICSTYLPDWRKGTDYRNNYSAFKSMGGGVELDCIHELDYIINLFGFPKSVKKQFGKYSNLEINSNDLATYILRYDDKIIEIHLDYFGRVPTRKFQLFTLDECINVDLLNNKISFEENIVKEMPESANDMYEKELKYFFENVVTGKENWNDLYHANEVLKIAEEK
ncbi:TPA: Gfo/Idh/MocA family oxidoreductase, partial [Enterococcus faecium]